MPNTKELHDEAVNATLAKLKNLNDEKWQNYFEEIGLSSLKGIDLVAKKGEKKLYFIVMKMKRGKGTPFDATKLGKWELASQYYGNIYFVAAIECPKAHTYDLCFLTPEKLWSISSIPQFQFICSVSTINIGNDTNHVLLPYDNDSSNKFKTVLKRNLDIMKQIRQKLKQLKQTPIQPQ